MIAATVGMAAMAVLFIAFGLTHRGGADCGGQCSGCSASCAGHRNGRDHGSES